MPMRLEAALPYPQNAVSAISSISSSHVEPPWCYQAAGADTESAIVFLNSGVKSALPPVASPRENHEAGKMILPHEMVRVFDAIVRGGRIFKRDADDSHLGVEPCLSVAGREVADVIVRLARKRLQRRSASR